MPKRAYERKACYVFRKSLEACIEHRARTTGWKESQIISSLAEHVGVDPNVVKNWLGRNNRSSYPDIEQGFDVACFFDTSVQKMVTGEDPMNVYSSPVIRRIVDILEPYSNNEILLTEIVGIVKHYSIDSNTHTAEYVAER